MRIVKDALFVVYAMAIMGFIAYASIKRDWFAACCFTGSFCLTVWAQSIPHAWKLSTRKDAR